MLRQEFETEDFMSVMRKHFASTYPSDEQKLLIWEFYKKAAKELFSGAVDGEKALALQKVVHAFLMPTVKQEFSKELTDISQWIDRHKLKSPQVNQFRIEELKENDKLVWVFEYKGTEIFKKERKSIRYILNHYVGIDNPALALALTETEKEGIYQAIFGKYIQEFRSSLPK